MSSQISRLWKQGQAFCARNVPAVVTIAGQEFAASTTGIQRERDPISGGFLEKTKVAFWIKIADFTAKGVPVPEPRSSVHFDGLRFLVVSAPIDPTAATIVLRCESPDR